MTAEVIQLSSRLPQPEQTCNCPASRLDRLASRLRAYRANSEGQLLIPAEVLDLAVVDALDVLGRILDETPHPTERTRR